MGWLTFGRGGPRDPEGNLIDDFGELLGGGLWEQPGEVVKNAAVRLVGRTLAEAGLVAVELFGRGQERPSPAVGAAVLVVGVDEIFGHHPAGRLEAGDVGVETAAHLGTGEATGGAQLARDHAAVGAEDEEDGVLDRAFLGLGVTAAPVVAEIGPPVERDEAGLASEELAVDTAAFGDDVALPFP